MRVRLSLFLLLVGLLSAGALRLAAQQGGSESPPSSGRLSPDDEKKRQFLKAREEMKTVPATPHPAAETPRPKPRPRLTPTPEPATPRPVTPRPESPRPNPATRSVSVTPYSRPATATRTGWSRRCPRRCRSRNPASRNRRAWSPRR